jgi:hypothetical protein
MRALVIALGLLLVAAPAFAGPNPQAALAMHTVASDAFLYCAELAHPGQYFPTDCSGIDPSATQAELDATGGYVYVVFAAYNVHCINGVEFAIGGWPTTRGVPAKPTINYCPSTSLVLGDPWTTGAIATFGETVCAQVECGGIVGFGWFVWGAYGFPTYLPRTLNYRPSAYSYPTDAHNYVLGPPPMYEEDLVVSAHGCVIKGVSTETYPDCDPGATAVEPTTWSNVKAMYK